MVVYLFDKHLATIFELKNHSCSTFGSRGIVRPQPYTADLGSEPDIDVRII